MKYGHRDAAHVGRIRHNLAVGIRALTSALPRCQEKSAEASQLRGRICSFALVYQPVYFNPSQSNDFATITSCAGRIGPYDKSEWLLPNFAPHSGVTAHLIGVLRTHA